jgi:purine nucleosidase
LRRAAPGYRSTVPIPLILDVDTGVDDLTFYADFYASTGRYEGACLHDPLALVAAIDPSVCTWADTRVQVELDGRWTRGETVTDLLAIRNSPWSDRPAEENARVATAVDARVVVDRMVERLRSLVETVG